MRPDFHCTVCGCNIGLKTHSLASGCPKGFWLPEVDKENEKDIEENLNLNFDDYETK